MAADIRLHNRTQLSLAQSTHISSEREKKSTTIGFLSKVSVYYQKVCDHTMCKTLNAYAAISLYIYLLATYDSETHIGYLTQRKKCTPCILRFSRLYEMNPHSHGHFMLLSYLISSYYPQHFFMRSVFYTIFFSLLVRIHVCLVASCCCPCALCSV